MRSGSIAVEELPEEVAQQCIEHFQKIEANMIGREEKEKKLAKKIKTKPPSDEELNGLSAYIPDNLRTPQLDATSTAMGWSIDNCLNTAKVYMFASLDMADIPISTSVAAALNGAWLTTPELKVWVKLQRGARTRRSVFLSTSFQAAHPELLACFQHHSVTDRAIKMLNTLEEFAVAKQKQPGASVVALHEEHETSIFESVPHTFTIRAFLDFIFKIDMTKSHFGH